MSCKFMIGSISYLKPGMKFLKERTQHHANQLRFWEQFDSEENPIDYRRVEIFWDDETKKALETTMHTKHIVVNEPSPPGKSRNFLLKELYASDADYLICCDDDQILDPGIEGFDLIKNLPISLAQEGAMITFQNETWITPAAGQKMIQLRRSDLGKAYHLLKRAMCTGNMQISCLPNLVKYGYEPLFFDEETMAQENEIPEDAKFQVDWLVAGHPVYICDTLFNLAFDSYIQSSIYKTGTFRGKTSKSRITILNAYIRSKVPTRTEILTLRDLSKAKNTAATNRLVPKTCETGTVVGEEKLLQGSYRKSRVHPRRI